MSSSRVISLDFDCRRPGSLEQALEELKQEGFQALAGGTDVLNSIKTNQVSPRCLVYLPGIPELQGLSLRGGTLRIGAAVRLRDIELDERVQALYPALAEAVAAIGSTQIRNLATLAGNLCTASPGADAPPILLALDAEVEIAEAGARGLSLRRLPLGSFFTGARRTVLKQGQLLAAVLLPRPAAGSGAAFRRLSRVSLDIAKINCAACLQREGNRIRLARVALGAVAPTPVRAPAVEAALAGFTPGRGGFRRAAALVQEDIAPIDDVRSTERYRRQVAARLLEEALEQAWQRAGGRP